MGHKFAEIAFTKTVREQQQTLGSRSGYAAMDEGADYNHILRSSEAAFISARDSFYLASVSETDWPYIQHRGGPVGFMRVLDEKTIGFADFSGNRQYVSTGNFKNNDKVALFFMDYANKTRLKLLGRVRQLEESETELLAALEDPNYRARVERGFIITVEAFDWNCPKFIPALYSEAQVEQVLGSLRVENVALKKAQKNSAPILPSELGDGPLQLVISAIAQQAPNIRSYQLRHKDGSKLPEVLAGSHIRVPVVLANGKRSVRDYTISSDPGQRSYYEIAVQREDNGEGGSEAVHQLYNLGLIINCSNPLNEFQLDTTAPAAVLIAGGIGITPIKAMASKLAEKNIPLHLHYAGRNLQSMAFLEELQRQFGEQLSLYSSAAGERLAIADILRSAPEDAVFYICGPQRLIDAVAQIAEQLAINLQRIRYERFNRD
ncbi:MAG: pyridoxamine 5'-phosphate oxidase family protein [Pseudomonadales bacterium]|nr:pyridoxamine 5'-phosphate oxidase family protein [Pseudomonadales bacterium]